MTDIKFKGAIFDQDGLLFDTEKIYQRAWLDMAREYGLEMDVRFPQQFCGKPQSLIAKIVESVYPGIDVPSYCRQSVERAWRIQLEGTPEAKPGLREMLEFCRGHGIRTAVASSSTSRVVEHNLSSAGVRGYFDAIVGGEEVVNGKPAPDIFLLAARKIGVDPRRCCVFEDAVSGITGAFRAGCRAVMVPDMVAPTPEVEGMCVVYPDLSQATAAFSL